jgi:hypothetical protein
MKVNALLGIRITVKGPAVGGWIPLPNNDVETDVLSRMVLV